MTAPLRVVQVAGLLLVVLLTACGAGGGGAGASGGADRPPPPQGEPYIQGTVTDVSPTVAVTENCVPPDPNAGPDAPVSSDDPPVCSTGDEPLGRILVEATDGGNQASLTIGRDTPVWERFGGGLEPSRFSRLGEGQTVQVWVSGPVAESFPVQATADAVVIAVE